MSLFDWFKRSTNNKKSSKTLVLFGGPKLYNNDIHTMDFYMAQSLGFESKNFALPRTSNYQIFHDASKYIINCKEEIGCIVICWMELPILTFGKNGHNIRNGFKFSNVHLMDFGSFKATLKKEDNPDVFIPEVDFPSESEKELFEVMCDNRMIFGEKYTNEMVRYINLIQKLCMKHDIPCVQAYAGDAKSVNERTIRNFKSSVLYNLIDSSKFYGYPINDDTGDLYLFKDCENPKESDYEQAARELLKCLKN